MCCKASIILRCLQISIHSRMLGRLDRNDEMPKMHSAYQKNHRTKTALVGLFNYIAVATDFGFIKTACMIDLSAAFDMVDHDILLSRLDKSYGFSRRAFEWIQFLSARTGSANRPISNKYLRKVRHSTWIRLGTVAFHRLHISTWRQNDCRMSACADDN